VSPAILLVAGSLLLQAGPAEAQSSPAPADTSEAEGAPRARGSRVFFGGAISFNVWNDYTQLSLEPHVGVRLTAKVSVGGKLRYEYLNDRRGSLDYDSHNYGGSIFSRYRITPALFAQVEYAYMSYDFAPERRGVPFLLVGGGYSAPLGKNAVFYAEVLIDLIQDEHSPYEAWSPRLALGISVGF
jgi:hypothetical protein